MSDNSTIEWTDATWNPVTGCDHVSPGCDNCYAEAIAKRFHRPFLGAIKCHSERLWYPQKWRKPRRVFVNSVSDLFHPDVGDAFIAEVFAVMALSQRHTFQVLTKRPQRMADLLARMFDEDRGINFRGLVQHAVDVRLAPDALAERRFEWPLPNVWLGVSVENQRYADLRIPHLLDTPAAVRFLSVEPMLGPITFRWAKWQPLGGPASGQKRGLTDHLDGLRRLDWVIVGGESGRGARPMHPAWARTIRDQCVEAEVPFFFKQWGQWISDSGGTHRVTLNGAFYENTPTCVMSDEEIIGRRSKHAAGRDLDGRGWDEYPS